VGAVPVVQIFVQTGLVDMEAEIQMLMDKDTWRQRRGLLWPLTLWPLRTWCSSSWLQIAVKATAQVIVVVNSMTVVSVT
jgi:hypothetical protein